MQLRQQTSRTYVIEDFFVTSARRMEAGWTHAERGTLTVVCAGLPPGDPMMLPTFPGGYVSIDGRAYRISAPTHPHADVPGRRTFAWEEVITSAPAAARHLGRALEVARSTP